MLQSASAATAWWNDKPIAPGRCDVVRFQMVCLHKTTYAIGSLPKTLPQLMYTIQLTHKCGKWAEYVLQQEKHYGWWWRRFYGGLCWCSGLDGKGKRKGTDNSRRGQCRHGRGVTSSEGPPASSRWCSGAWWKYILRTATRSWAETKLWGQFRIESGPISKSPTISTSTTTKQQTNQGGGMWYSGVPVECTGTGPPMLRGRLSQILP